MANDKSDGPGITLIKAYAPNVRGRVRATVKEGGTMCQSFLAFKVPNPLQFRGSYDGTRLPPPSADEKKQQAEANLTLFTTQFTPFMQEFFIKGKKQSPDFIEAHVESKGSGQNQTSYFVAKIQHRNTQDDNLAMRSFLAALADLSKESGPPGHQGRRESLPWSR